MTKKILIVDDDPAITKYLETLLTDNGYATFTANDGEQAAALFKKESPDLLTLDIAMPDEWGTRFYRKISKTRGFDTPVIVISGLAGRKFSIPKAAAFFAKPFDAEELLAKVKEVLGE
ncbi:MAG: response regulator [Desulfobacteraceae bacterium]